MSKADISIHGFVDLHVILPGLGTREVKTCLEDLVNDKSLLVHLTHLPLDKWSSFRRRHFKTHFLE